MKICRKKVDGIFIDLQQEEEGEIDEIHMPIGNYVDYHVEPTCGIVSQDGYIDVEDEASVFYNPARVNANG